MRLNVYLARAGIASRRKADDFIKDGRVRVNGRTGQLNDEINENDEVTLDGKKVELQSFRYILLNKPGGCVTTLADPQGRKTVIDLIKVQERIVPVGRLDFDTTGVLLLTNDGELANKLMHPRLEVDKVYEATIKGNITTDKLEKLRKGVKIEGWISAPAKVRLLRGRASQEAQKIELTIHEGRKHQVKKMLAAVNLPVTKLHRSKYAGIGLGKLKAGEWRELTVAEIKMLK